MSRSLYNLMQDAEEDRGEFNNLFPDTMTLPINRFRTTLPPETYYLTEIDVKRFDILIANYYSVSDYTDIVLWYNNISFHLDMEVGQAILLPDVRDISAFYVKYAL